MKEKKSTKLYDSIGPFTTIPNSVVKMTKTIGTDALALWVYLRYRTNGESGVAFPSYTTIQKDTGLSRNKVAKCLTVLEENGLLYKERRFGNSNTYELQMPPVVLMRDYSSPDADTIVVQHQDTNKTDTTNTDIEQESRERGERVYSDYHMMIAKTYYGLLSEEERAFFKGKGKFNILLNTASQAFEGIDPAALEAEFRAMRADAFYLDKTPALLTILKRLAAKHATAQAAPSGARAGVRVVGQAVRNG